MRRISPEGSLILAYSPSFAMSCAPVPAERTIFAPVPFDNSMLCIKVPTGIFFIGRAFPVFISASGPDITVSPTFRSTGAIMYLRSPPSYSKSARKADLFGSYSSAMTLEGTPTLSRLKSTILIIRLWPPPWWRTVTWPWLLRPAFFFLGIRSAFSGSFFVSIEKSDDVIHLLDFVYGLYVFSICFTLCRYVYFIALAQCDYRLLPIRRLARLEPYPAPLA